MGRSDETAGGQFTDERLSNLKTWPATPVYELSQMFARVVTVVGVASLTEAAGVGEPFNTLPIAKCPVSI